MPKAEKPKGPPLPSASPQPGDSKLQAPVDELRNVQPGYEDAVLPGGGPAGDTRWTRDQEGAGWEPGMSTPPVTPGGHFSSPTVDVVEEVPWPKGHANYQMSGVPDYSNDNMDSYRNPDGTVRYKEGSLVSELSKTADAEDDERTSRELNNFIERLNNPKEQLPMHPKPWEDSPNSLGGKQKITSEENGALRMIGTMWEGPFGHWSEGDIPWAFCVPIAIAAMKRVAPEIAAEYEKTVLHVWKLYSDWWSKYDATAEDAYGDMDKEPDFMRTRLPSRAYDYYIDEDYGPQETCRVEVVDKDITSSIVSELTAGSDTLPGAITVSIQGGWSMSYHPTGHYVVLLEGKVIADGRYDNVLSDSYNAMDSQKRDAHLTEDLSHWRDKAVLTEGYLVSELCADLERPMLKPRFGKAVIELVEQMPVVTIKWEDVTFTDGEPLETLQDAKPATFWTTGFLYDEDESGVVILMELDQDELNPNPDREPTSTYQYIPKGLIKDMKHWGTFSMDDKDLPWKSLGTRRAPKVKVAGLLRAGVVASVGSGVVEAEEAIAKNWGHLFDGHSVDWEQAYRFIPRVTASVEAYIEEAKANEDLFIYQIQSTLRSMAGRKKVKGAGQTGENPDGIHTTNVATFPSGDGRRENRIPTDPRSIRQWTDQPNTAPEQNAPSGGGNVTEQEIYNPSTSNTSGTDLKDSDTDNLQFGFPDSRVRLLPKNRKGDPMGNAAESGSMRLFD